MTESPFSQIEISYSSETSTKHQTYFRWRVFFTCPVYLSSILYPVYARLMTASTLQVWYFYCTLERPK